MSEIKNLALTPVIITCIDVNNASSRALNYACLKAKKMNFDLLILAVTEASYKNMMFGARAIAQDRRQQIEKNIKKLTDEINQRLGITPKVSIREGEIMTEIIREIKSTPNCAMLVLGKSHNSLSDNTVLPKVAQKIGNKIKVPVTIVPENLSDEFLEKLV
ncbi:MAG: universal stress protein [Rickettsiales bacterium]|nr:universal stress protein [Rickettsiales bacterium]